MAFNATIPQSTDQQKNSQPELLANFAATAALIAVNHVPFNSVNPTQGKHTFVEMPVQNPVPATIAGEVGLYCQNSTLTAQPELVFSKQLGSTAPVTTYEVSSAGYTTFGWSRDVSGILKKWGQGTAVGGVITIIPFPIAATIPAFAAAPLNIQITPINAPGVGTLISTTAPGAWSNLDFGVTTVAGAGNFNFQYLAIGY